MPTAKEVLDQAWQYHQQGDSRRAEQLYRFVLDRIPDYASAWFYLGIVLHDQKRFGEAVAAYRQAVQIRPEFPSAWNNLGNSLRFVFQPEEAEACFRTALSQKPGYAMAHKNRGTLHVWNGNFELARSCYEEALRLTPDDPELHRSLGLLSLRQGDFVRGWTEFRWRWRCPESPRPPYTQPVWRGEPLADKTILLYTEQGLGDALHFVRFAPLLKQRGARTIVYVPDVVERLLRTCPGIDSLVIHSQAVEQSFDYHCSLIDAAEPFLQHVEDIPPGVPYVQPASELVSRWRAWCDSLPGDKRRVGLVWQGNRGNQTDPFRSLPLSVLEPLGDIDAIQLVSLQHGFGSEQLDGWRGRNPIARLPEGIDRLAGPFMDTAAILSQLDLLITPDTAIAHLAGAIGTPVCLLLNLVPDWRWFLDRRDTPWYPTFRLFRQTRQGDWPGVVHELCSALRSGELNDTSRSGSTRSRR
jgi:tetratricopeptide (TPR) repeat protein